MGDDLFVYRNMFSLMQYLTIRKQQLCSDNTAVTLDTTYADHKEDRDIIEKCCRLGIFTKYINITDLDGVQFVNIWVSSDVKDELIQCIFKSKFDRCMLLQEGVSLFDQNTQYSALNKFLIKKSSKQFVTVNSLPTNNDVPKQKIDIDVMSIVPIISDNVEKIKDIEIERVLFTSPIGEAFDLNNAELENKITKNIPKSVWVKRHPRDHIDWKKLGYKELPQIVCSEIYVMLFSDAEKIFMYPSSTQLTREDDRFVNLKFSTDNTNYNKQFNNCIEVLGIKDSHIEMI